MRNPIVIFFVGLVLVFVSALISIQFDVMTMSEFLAKLKMLSVLLVPIAIFGGAFAYSQLSQPKKTRD